MNLVWREFERKWRQLYRAELARSPALRDEVKRQRKSDNKTLPELARRILLPLFWCSIFLSVAGKQSRVDMPAAALALWAAGAAFRWGHHWFQQFYASEDLVVLNILPLNDSKIFQFQLRRYLGSAGWLFWEMLLAYLVLGFIDGGIDVPSFPKLILAGLLQAVLVMALALHLASWLHIVPLGSIGGLLRISAVGLLIFGTESSDLALYLKQATEWFLPTGWINYILLHSADDPAVYALVIPLLAIIYLARYSFNRLRNFYSLAGLEILPSRSAAAEHEEELTAESFGGRPGPTEIEDRILARHFLEGVNWELSGALEKFSARFLSGRERVITEFLVAGNPGWTNTLKLSFWIWMVTCTVVLLLGQFGGTIVFFAAYVLATTSLPIFGGEWRGMRQSASGGVYIPAYSVYPISFNAIAMIFLKINLIRIAAASPLILSFATLAAARLGQGPLAGAMIGAKLLGIVVCVQPLFVLFPISNSTNDASRGRIITRVLFLTPVLVIILGAVVTVFISQTALGVAASYLILILFSVLLFLAYRRAYRRGKFDLLTERSPAR